VKDGESEGGDCDKVKHKTFDSNTNCCLDWCCTTGTHSSLLMLTGISDCQYTVSNVIQSTLHQDTVKQYLHAEREERQVFCETGLTS